LMFSVFGSSLLVVVVVSYSVVVGLSLL